MNSEKIEDIVLRYSKRGMTILREYMTEDYCAESAKDILSWEKGTVFLTTGFYAKQTRRILHLYRSAVRQIRRFLLKIHIILLQKYAA